MPNLTTAFPKKTGDLEKDYERLYKWSVALTDELKSILCNLDSGNVIEASKVKAQNIDVSQAKIKDAQVQSLTADKLTAGAIDTGSITIGSRDDDGKKITIEKQYILFEENYNIRIAIGKIDDNGGYVFTVQNEEGTQGVFMDDSGKITVTGNIEGGSINVNDVNVGRKIVLNDRDDLSVGSGYAGTVSVDNNRVVISAKNNRAIYLSTGGAIFLDCTECYLNGKKVVVEG